MITRTLVSVPLAFLLSLLLFYTLALITRMGDGLADERQVNPNLDFSMHVQESEIALRERRLPDEPEELVQQQPAMPQVKTEMASTLNASLPDISIPDIDVGVKLSPSFSSLSFPAPAVSVNTNVTSLAMPTPMMTIDTNPTVMSQVPPRYPQRALRRRQEGRVLVEFVITATGTVKPGSMKVIESIPKGVFDKTVLRSMQRWRFKTRLANGQPSEYRARQELEFKLEK
ncbi:energy transducer TonB [Neptunomonas japonica]|uniref:energy transducer TonB n=1 Tax=Neptunomonas japonica TaxID=417574 RepID=UPI000688E5DB|nr:energy transducer TonB [Neptunomonas japonica]